MSEGRMANGAKYTPFGGYMYWVSNHNKGVRGPYRAATYMERTARERGYDLGLTNRGEPREMPKGGAVSKYYLGNSYPEPWWVLAFADLFDLTPEQREDLADHYAYRFRVELAMTAPEEAVAA